MISQINRTIFNLRLLTLFLPLWSFMLIGAVGWQRIITNIDPYPYFGLLVFATVAWPIAVENCGLCTPKYILTSGGNVYAAFLATLMTLFAELLIMFFYRATSFSRRSRLGRSSRPTRAATPPSRTTRGRARAFCAS